MSSKKKRGCLWWLFIGWWYAPLKWILSHLNLEASQPTSDPPKPLLDPTPAPSKPKPLTDTPQPNVEHHRIAGTSFRLEAIKELLEENPDYSLSKRELMDYGLVNERIYKMEVYRHSAVLEPEPENPSDPKAIKIVVEGVHIGYIKAGSCAHIHKVLREGRLESAEVEIKGGEYKILLEDFDEDGESVYSLERYTIPLSAVLSLTLKKDRTI